MLSGSASSSCSSTAPRATGWCRSSRVREETSPAAAYCLAASGSSTSLKDAKAAASNILCGGNGGGVCGKRVKYPVRRMWTTCGSASAPKAEHIGQCSPPPHPLCRAERVARRSRWRSMSRRIRRHQRTSGAGSRLVSCSWRRNEMGAQVSVQCPPKGHPPQKRHELSPPSPHPSVHCCLRQAILQQRPLGLVAVPHSRRTLLSHKVAVGHGAQALGNGGGRDGLPPPASPASCRCQFQGLKWGIMDPS